jgi:ABC-2 type transport system permease protein
VTTHTNWLFAQLRRGLTAHNLRLALADVTDGARRYGLWGTLGLQDIRQRYRRSSIGPLWITLSMGIFIGALGLLYGKLFGNPLEEYLPYLAAGFLVWAFLSTSVLDGAKVFVNAGGTILQLNAPLSVYVYKTVWINLIIFLHNIWVYLFIALWFGISPGWAMLLVIPALLLLLLNAVWVGLLLGLVSARFRDLPIMLTSVIQLVFFLTPIIWKPEMLPDRPLLLVGNPFYHYVEVLRAPLLGQMPSLSNIGVVLAGTISGWAVCLFFYTAYRWRIAYWV